MPINFTYAIHKFGSVITSHINMALLTTHTYLTFVQNRFIFWKCTYFHTANTDFVFKKLDNFFFLVCFTEFLLV
jgi:hypothetical protein